MINWPLHFFTYFRSRKLYDQHKFERIDTKERIKPPDAAVIVGEEDINGKNNNNEKVDYEGTAKGMFDDDTCASCCSFV